MRADVWNSIELGQLRLSLGESQDDRSLRCTRQYARHRAIDGQIQWQLIERILAALRDDSPLHSSRAARTYIENIWRHFHTDLHMYGNWNHAAAFQQGN